MFEPLRLIDVPTLAREATDGWYNQILCRVNDSVVRVGVFRKGELHWHKHDNQDEMFFVLEGQFIIELETETITLEPHQGFTVPRGVLHRTRAPQRAVILIIEGAAVQPTEGS